MSLSSLPLSYCTNVHPGDSAAEVEAGLRTYTAEARRLFNRPLAAGLWLSANTMRELSADGAAVSRLRDTLRELDLCCYTLNAFPYGDFHSPRVKEQVYVPDWTTDARSEYTLSCARVLAQLLPEGTEGSISTVPLGFTELSVRPDFITDCIAQLLGLAKELSALHKATGRMIRLAIEPEPLCVLETTDETLFFFQQLTRRADKAGLADVARRFIGVCYDICHQAVEFEDVAASVAALAAIDVRINKVHITCALRLEQPLQNAEARRALAYFVEPRYLHQTFARSGTGEVSQYTDLDADLCDNPAGAFAEASEWRVHYHVPVNADAIGPLGTTRDDVERALAAVARLPYAPHLEVETYTWGVLPGTEKPPLAKGLADELTWTRNLLDRLEQDAAL